MSPNEFDEWHKQRKQLWNAMRLVEPNSFEAFHLLGRLMNDPTYLQIMKFNAKRRECSNGRA